MPSEFRRTNRLHHYLSSSSSVLLCKCRSEKEGTKCKLSCGRNAPSSSSSFSTLKGVWVERGAAGVFYINLGTTSFVGAARVIFEQEVSVVWDLKNGFDLQIYMISSDLAFCQGAQLSAIKIVRRTHPLAPLRQPFRAQLQSTKLSAGGVKNTKRQVPGRWVGQPFVHYSIGAQQIASPFS